MIPNGLIAAAVFTLSSLEEIHEATPIICAGDIDGFFEYAKQRQFSK
jgi:hypothetical protein